MELYGARIKCFFDEVAAPTPGAPVSDRTEGKLTLTVAAIPPDLDWHEEPRAQQSLLIPPRSRRYTENV
jgi:hypothetical protein